MSQGKQSIVAKQMNKTETKQRVQTQQVSQLRSMWGQHQEVLQRSLNDPHDMNVTDIAYLKRAVGNQALGGLSTITRKRELQAHSVRQTVDVQRKCACGQSTVDNNECIECRNKRLTIRQPTELISNRSLDGSNSSMLTDAMELQRSLGNQVLKRLGPSEQGIKSVASSNIVSLKQPVRKSVNQDHTHRLTSKGQLWSPSYTVQQTINQPGLLIQRMVPCPPRLAASAPIPSGWKPYHGNSCIFHCCFRGILENRRPNPSNPQNECFYDNRGILVNEAHKYAGCRGTPNQYDSASNPIKHAVVDRGGIVRSGVGAFFTSVRHAFERK